MAPHGGSDSIAGLRTAIARIEARPFQAFAPPRESGRKTPIRLVGGADEPVSILDRALDGGLQRDGLHEVVPARPGEATAATGFALALAARFALGRPKQFVLWVAEDFSRSENGAPYGPGLLAHGLDPQKLIVVNAAKPQEALWVVEEALRAGALCAVLGELREHKRDTLVVSRRLLLAARKSATPCILLHVGAAGQGGGLSSAADTRFAVAGAASARARPFWNARPLPGLPAWSVRLLKARARSGLGFDPERSFPLVWNPEERCLRDVAYVSKAVVEPARAPVAVRRLALSGDRTGDAPPPGARRGAGP